MDKDKSNGFLRGDFDDDGLMDSFACAKTCGFTTLAN
jgi:hypothetical protein